MNSFHHLSSVLVWYRMLQPDYFPDQRLVRILHEFWHYTTVLIKALHGLAPEYVQ